MRNLWLAAAVAVLLPTTQTVTFKAATMNVTQTVNGSCWTTSIASRRKDAFRCMSGNSIHDPCFAINAKTVACPENPAENSGVRIALTKALPPANSGNTHNTWMMKLSGGAMCNVGTGTVIENYPFYCTGNIVCAAPASSASGGTVYVRCGLPKNAVTVTATKRYLVTTLYQ
jgi:hypothetical protein